MRSFTSLLLLFLLMHYPGFGCLCVQGITTKYSYNKADIVVHATIIGAKDLSEISTMSNNTQTITLKGFEYTAVIIQQYKGTKIADTIIINPGPGSCEMPFHIGGTYLIFASSEPANTYGTSMCSGNKLYNKNDHKTLLKLSRRNNR